MTLILCQSSAATRRVAGFAFIAACALVETPFAKVPFEVGGHKAFVIAAPQPAPGKLWVWDAPTRGANLPGAGQH